MDGSAVGRNCVTLMVSITYHGRAIPIAWLVVTGKKGHLPEDLHLQLLTTVRERMPADATRVVFLGDGEFDGTDLQAALTAAGWEYVCRTATNTLLWHDDVKYHCADMQPQADQMVYWPGVRMTGGKYGPVHAIGIWGAEEQKPIHLVTTIADAERAVQQYRNRAHIETFFSDQKSRGFRLDKSHISDPKRLARLMIAACLAYIWILSLGRVAHRERWVRIIHRGDRCDLSLFQLGLRLLQYWLNEELPIRVGFSLVDEPLL